MSARVFNFLPPYSISGESGKALGSSRVTMESQGIVDAVAEFRSMAPDTITWYQRGGSAPEYGQAVSVWDNAGTRIFTGNCTASDPDWGGTGQVGCQVTISGPFWWLELAQLTSLVTDDLATAQERVTFLFPAQDLAISITSLLDRMETLGVPLAVGEIDATFAVQQMVMQGSTGADALRAMLDWIPDATTRVRYDAAGLPRLDILRRPTAPVATLALGTNTDRTGIPKLRAQRQLRPTSVRVQSMTVNAAGQIVYSEQTAGDTEGATGVLGRQLISVSGPGRPDYRDVVPRVGTIQTTTIPATYSGLWALARANDPAIIKAEGEFGNVTWTSYGDHGLFPALPRGLSGTGSYRRISGQVLDFMKTEFSLSEATTRVSGWIFGTYPSGGYGTVGTYLINQGLAAAVFSGGYYNFCVWVDFTLPTVSASYPSLTVFVHPDDQALVTPVSGLADNLFAAQNWTPYDGTIPLHPAASHYLPGSSLNITGGLPDWATMASPIVGSRIDLTRGISELTIGARNRIAAGTLIDRFARAASSRVIEL